MRKAGNVNTAPAATDSPMEPAVRAIFSSRIVPFHIRTHRHTDHRRRICSRNGHACAKAQICVGRPQHYAHG